MLYVFATFLLIVMAVVLSMKVLHNISKYLFCSFVPGYLLIDM